MVWFLDVSFGRITCFLCAFLICELVLWGLSVWSTWWIPFPQKLSVYCSLLSTENSLDFWGKWHEKKRDFSLVLENGKVVKDRHPCLSFHSNSFEMPERFTLAVGSSISCVAPGWRQKGLLCVPLHFQLNLEFSLSSSLFLCRRNTPAYLLGSPDEFLFVK